MPDIFVQTFSHLKDKHNADKALEILKRVASLVKPIMRKRNWVLPVLAEFFPDNANLLGIYLFSFFLQILETSWNTDADSIVFGQDLVSAFANLCQGRSWLDDDLDVNMGQQILVRLRPYYAPDTFLPEETIVGTMLHEVCMHTQRTRVQNWIYNLFFLVNT